VRKNPIPRKLHIFHDDWGWWIQYAEGILYPDTQISDTHLWLYRYGYWKQ
jgi:hypothetical protein